ncbi:MAG: hypothetical protein ABSD70_15355 [Terracidiphilus sp.]
METTLRNLRIQTVRAQLSALETECIALAHWLDNENPADEERAATAYQWNEAMQESIELQSKLDKLLAFSHVTVH